MRSQRVRYDRATKYTHTIQVEDFDLESLEGLKLKGA